MNDPPDVRQADSGAFELIIPVEPLEYPEEFVHVLHVEPDPVVANKDCDFARELPRRTDLDAGCGPRGRELDRIRDEVHEHLPQHRRIARDIRQRANCPGDRPSLQVKTQIVNDGLDQLIQIYRTAQHFLPAHAGEHEHVVTQLPHLLGRFRDGLEIPLSLVIQRRTGGFRQERCVTVDMTQRGAKVVRDGITKRLQFLVRGLQEFPLPPQFCRGPTPVRDVVMDEIVDGTQQYQLQDGAKSKQRDGTAGGPCRLQQSGTGGLLLIILQIRDELVNLVELPLRHAWHCQLAYRLSTSFSPLLDGVSLDVQLLLDELFHLGNTFALLRYRSGEGLKIT